MYFNAAMKTRFIGLLTTSLALQALGTPAALMAGPSSVITASGMMPETVEVVVPPLQSSTPLEIAPDGGSLTVANTEPVTIIANIPSRVQMSPLQINTPNDVSPSNVGADIQLLSNGTVLIGASTSYGGSQPFAIGQVQATVNARFYSTTNVPLAAGTYTATTVLSVIAE